MARDLEEEKTKSTDEDNEIDGFLNHSSSDRSGGYVGNWKKDGKLNVFLHTRRKPLPIWYHPLPRKHVKESDDGEAVTHIYSGKYVCHEEEAVLKKQYKYTDDDARVLPPQRCPLCFLIEAVRGLVNAGKLKWTQKLFVFEGDEPDETKIIHAGGMIGEFGGDNLSDNEKKALKDAGIRRDEAWSQNFRAKLNYIFWIVDADNVSKGLLTATETGLLGDKVKDVINDAMESLGDEKGNPLKNPYCIQWEYRDERGLPFNKKYAARRIERIRLTPDIEEIIRGPRPDSSKIEERFDAAAMRTILEAAATPEARALIPWDECFPKGRRKVGNEDIDDIEGEDSDPADVRNKKKEDDRAPQQDEDGDDVVFCDDGNGKGCGKPIKITDAECPHCHLKFDVEDEEPEPKPEPQRNIRSRAEVKAEQEKRQESTKKGEKKKLPF